MTEVGQGRDRQDRGGTEVTMSCSSVDRSATVVVAVVAWRSSSSAEREALAVALVVAVAVEDVAAEVVGVTCRSTNGGGRGFDASVVAE